MRRGTQRTALLLLIQVGTLMADSTYAALKAMNMKVLTFTRY